MRDVKRVGMRALLLILMMKTAHRRKGHSIRKRRTRGGGSSGAHASSGHLFSPRSGLSAAVAASLVIALASLAYMHWRSSDHGGQERAARLKTTAALDEAGGTERVTENTIEGSFAASRRIRRWGFQSKDEAFRVLDGQGTAATGGGMPEGVPGGWEAKANRTGGGSGGNDKGHGELRKPPKSEREAFSEGRGEISERATEEGLRVQSRKTGWLSAVQNLALGSFSRAHRASETIREPPAIERRGDAIVEPVGGVDGEAAGGLVPEWVRPTTQELEDIVRTQFGPWRTLSDASPEAFANGSVDASNRRHGSSEGCFPMRQGMAPYLEEHLRRCYAAMRQGYQFGAPLRQVAVVTMGEHKDVKASPRGVVALMSTSRPNDLKNLMKSLRTLSRNFLDDHAYPVAIIHEDFSTELMESLRDIVPVPIHFVEVEFKLPDWMEPLSWIYPLAVKHYTGHPKSMPLVGFHSDMHGMLPYVKRGNFGYFHMCRFFGGAGYMLPFFDNFDLYLRLDSDSFCSERLPDYFMKLEKAGADYAFDSTFLDFGDKAQGLWNFAERYMRDRNVSPTFWKRSKSGGQISKVLAKANERPPYPKCSNQSPQEETVVSIQGTKIHPVPCRDRHFQAVPAFYTNFEVARIKMLRSSWYQDWFNAIDKTGSIYYSRWGDAPIRFIGLSMHLPESKILKVSGCRHD